jgi:diacylglycerol kinase (ATP)
MSKPGKTGIARVIDATRYSKQGLLAAWRHESAFRQECTLALLLLPLAWLLGTTTAERLLLIAVLGLVLITELLNSGIEAVVDRVGHEHHDLAGRAKDMGSAAVFISLSLVLVVWGTVAIQRFL